MKRVLLVTILILIAWIGFTYQQIYDREAKIDRVKAALLSDTQTRDLLGEPTEILTGIDSISNCGVGAKTLRYKLESTVLILRFEDGIGISFRADGSQCDVNRTSI